MNDLTFASAKVQWSSAAISDCASVPLKALRVGTSGDRYVVVAGVHGNETTPLYVLRRFLEETEHTEACTIDIIPVVNVLGVALGTRREPLCGEDMNRLLLAQAPDSVARQVMSDLVKFCAEAEVVVDLHCWDSPSAVIGICHRAPVSGPSRELRVLASFGCDYVWIPGSEDGIEGTLGQELTRLGIANCAIELPAPGSVDRRGVGDFSKRLRKALVGPHSRCQLRCGQREAIHAVAAGLYDPLVSAGEDVNQGTCLGRFLDPGTLAVQGVASSHCTGILMDHAGRRVVHRGEVVAHIGTGGDDLSASIAEVN